jgi:hypothetical protein
MHLLSIWAYSVFNKYFLQNGVIIKQPSVLPIGCEISAHLCLVQQICPLLGLR